MRGDRRELVLALLLSALGGGLALWATTRTWAVLVTDFPAPLPTKTQPVSGREVAGLSFALSLVGLAGALALLATRAAGRLVLGLLLSVTGVGIIADSLSARGGGSVPGRDQATSVSLHTGWAPVAAVGGVLVLLAGVLALLRGRRWARMSARYEAPGARVAQMPGRANEGGAAQWWDAMDREQDPTSTRAAANAEAETEPEAEAEMCAPDPPGKTETEPHAPGPASEAEPHAPGPAGTEVGHFPEPGVSGGRVGSPSESASKPSGRTGGDPS